MTGVRAAGGARRAAPRPPRMTAERYLTELERELMLGSGRWAADFTESFRHTTVAGATFDALVRGNTRPRGFLLSRVFATLLAPDYQVACLVRVGPASLDRLRELASSALAAVGELGLAWAWAVAVAPSPLSEPVRRWTQAFSDRRLGLGVVSLASGEVVTAESFLGRQLRSRLRRPT
jgi:hypothetical protein